MAQIHIFRLRFTQTGILTSGTTPAQTNSNNLTSTTYCPIVAALWDDLHTGRVADATYPFTSSVQTLLEGTAPNRSFTIQYKYAYWYYNVSTSWVDFQVVLKENGCIQINYGANFATSPSASASASVGINMLPGGVNNYFSITPGNPATASSIVANNSINASIPNGTIYCFNPPLLVQNDLGGA